jgi:hypothetical protein
VVLPHYPVILCGELCLLVSWCAGGRCDMAGSDEDRGRSRRLGVEDRRWSNTGSATTVCLFGPQNHCGRFLVWVKVKRKKVGSMVSGAAQRKSDQTTLILL